MIDFGRWANEEYRVPGEPAGMAEKEPGERASDDDLPLEEE